MLAISADGCEIGANSWLAALRISMLDGSTCMTGTAAALSLLSCCFAFRCTSLASVTASPNEETMVELM